MTLAVAPCQAQPVGQFPCGSTAEQDSLIARYIERGAQRYGYNHPNWEKYCDSLIARCPRLALAYREKAIPYLKNGDYARAFALEDQAVALDPRAWTAYRGFLKCIFTKDYAGALPDFKRAEQLSPGSYEMDHTYAFYRGLCLLELGRYAEAATALATDRRQQIQGDPQRQPHFNSLFYEGVLRYEMKQPARAVAALRQCLGQYRQFGDAHYYLALCYQQQGLAAQARQHLALAHKGLKDGYSINEDNVFYANYPHQITLFEVEQAQKLAQSRGVR